MCKSSASTEREINKIYNGYMKQMVTLQYLCEIVQQYKTDYGAKWLCQSIMVLTRKPAFHGMSMYKVKMWLVGLFKKTRHN